MRIKSIVIALSLFNHLGNAAPAAVTPAEKGALNLDWLDKTILPESDFFLYANGTWQKENPIPPEYASWNAFYVLQENILDFIHQMLTTMAADKTLKPGSVEQKVADFYASGMNEQQINAEGLKPLQPLFNQITGIHDQKSLQSTLASLQIMGVNAGFAFGSMQDYKDSKEMIGAAFQAGLGLPDRDYYLKDDAHFKAIRDVYRQHLVAMFKLAGDSPNKAGQEAETVLSMETELAQASMSKVAQRDPNAVYHRMTIKQLEQATPTFSWVDYFKAIGKPDIASINLAMPAFFSDFNTMLTKRSLNDWQVYLRWQVLDAFAAYLSKPFVDENFRMVSALNGAKKLQPRWKRVINTENQALGFAIGKLYVEKKFSTAEKQQVLSILHDIRETLRHELQNLSWMTPATREAALKKLDKIEERVGFPDKWWDYSKLQVNRDGYVQNVMHANQFLINRDLDKIGKPVDRSEWAITPQTINAYYDPSMNNINIPAGILQPPFYDPAAPAAVNYGGIGFVIAHEITHGFDDQGAQFDGEGNLRNWWTDEDLKKFKTATQCVANQFSGYKIQNTLPVQGQLVVGEATADLGGLRLAYQAFHHSKAFKDAHVIDGFTPDQQFFLGFAHVWAGNMRPEEARNRLTTDPHPPMTLRVNGTLANMPEFQQAFPVSKPGLMRNANQCLIW